ncbi:DNA methyltransferase [Dyadobacter flavalbus]|uniref:site-specific DNA-methyltransferase (adenine-specific) n=1 Tax=Dyadobacter flavalbus TaxID=2579942 RepID=A0A5M8QPG9_9BACT|nr:type ISP restriction/modification enzyme [Dyadobacter flavalbus]KAA6437969.1 DNA methyltransferase [Dyadobacter flavalbus]
MTLPEYIEKVSARYKLGNTTEHTFRGELTQLIESLVPAIRATNEPKRQACGAPDYIITKNDIPVGFIEAKDIGDRDLLGSKKAGNKEQFDRYKASLNNLIFTDYLDFHLYQEGQFVKKISIGELTDKGIKPLTENFSSFENLIKNFCIHIGQTIKSSKQLAEMMAAKARLLSEVIEKALTSDKAKEEDSTLKDQMNAFKDVLIHDITPKGFADVYAQTIAYGMFAARLHDATLPTFSRQEAAELIPKSNPFLRKLFGYIAGPDIDDRIKWIVDSLVDVFLACDVEKLLKNYGKATKMEDPIIHFYETFLSEYDPALRKARGVWYTPAPVVNFIVRAVDDILKTDFGLPAGLADTSKTIVKLKHQVKATADTRSKIKEVEEEREIHRIQILDPATGTGTFLAEIVKHVYKRFEGQQGNWSNYVETQLLPRLNGFELLMASYAMAHLKLDLLLNETGYKATKDQRLKVYLTNSLEEHHPDTGTLFANWLSTEANEANRIKRDTPVMCIIGNPPYSGESTNKGKWIMNLMEDYKKEPGGNEKLKEQNSKFINDDYVKFLRCGQHFIEKNGTGVLAFINPHGFLDNPTFRGMRWNLLKTYDKIYTIDLHGNAKKKETAPDGSADVNIFDIEQGVSINIFVKTGKKKANELGKVSHYELFGKRELKYNFLAENSLKSISFNSFTPFKNSFLFKSIDEDKLLKYNEGINPVNLFQINVMGFQTHRDEFCIDENKKNLIKKLFEFSLENISDEEISKKYGVKSSIDFSIKKAQMELTKNDISKEIIKCGYRPFEEKYIYFNKYLVDRPRKELLIHSKNKENITLGIGRQGLAIGDIEWCLVTVSKYPVDANMFRRGGINLFPLYLYPETSSQQSTGQIVERTPNLKSEIVKQIADKLGISFVPEKENNSVHFVNNNDKLGDNYKQAFAPIDLLDYIYAILHSPAYRKKYKEFLKIDFPRVPYPKDAVTFWQLVKLGGEIRQIHLFESFIVEKYITQYPISGDNEVIKPRFEVYDYAQTTLGEETPDYLGVVHINDTQYFANVPTTAWEFYIGGYQPAQKWLKDRKGRKLEFDDISHYQKIIVALTETARIMEEIDAIIQL